MKLYRPKIHRRITTYTGEMEPTTYKLARWLVCGPDQL
jgi:hypothetical protein